jgi:hypothetical protein
MDIRTVPYSVVQLRTTATEPLISKSRTNPQGINTFPPNPPT